MSTNLDIHHLAAAYALDALDDRERPAFAAHYPACEVCAPDVHDFRSTLTAISVLSATPPPADVKDAVIGQIATTRQLSPLLPHSVGLAGRRRSIAKSMLAAAAAVLLIVGTAASASGRWSHTDNAFRGRARTTPQPTRFALGRTQHLNHRRPHTRRVVANVR